MVEKRPTCRLSVSASDPFVGDSLRLSVEVTGNATEVRLDETPLARNQTFKEWTPQSAGRFRAEAIVRGPGGASSCSLSYEIRERAPTCVLEASPTSTLVGDPLVAKLKTSGKVTDAAIGHIKLAFPIAEAKLPTDTAGVFPISATVIGPGGTGTCQTTYEVRDRAPTCVVSVSPAVLPLGGKLDVQVEGNGKITGATIEGNSVSFPKGQATLQPVLPGKFTVTAAVQGPGGKATCVANYQVLDPPPSCQLVAAPTPTALGNSLTFTLTGVGNITASTIDGMSVASPVGQKMIQAMNIGSFTSVGEVTGPGGSAKCEGRYEVVDAPSCTLVATPPLVASGAEVTLSLTSTGGVVSAKIDQTAITAPAGKIVIHPKASGKFIAKGEVTSPFGKATCQASYGISVSHVITKTVKDVSLVNDLDMLWVIDNSASMSPYQQAVKDNMDAFMNEYTKITALKWKMGLISTDVREKPYLGFTPLDVLSHLSPQPVATFNDGVKKLGIGGSSVEQMFKPVMKTLDENPNFLRPGAGLAIITVTDAPEQSSETAYEFLRYLERKKGDLKTVFGYGIFGAKDLGCKNTDDAWDYKGSKYEEFVSETKGKVFPICDKDFGKSLLDLAKQIILSAVFAPKIMLPNVPLPGTIKVFYKGQQLPEGLIGVGGYWIYEASDNSIVFQDLSFATGLKEEAEVHYQSAP